MATENSSSEKLILTDMVREHYVRYLERQLQENVCVWAGTSRNHHKATAWACIAHSVEAMETLALKACQVTQLYQRAMIKMIANVRRNTQECRLADNLFDQMQKKEIAEDVISEKIYNANHSVHLTHNLIDKATQTASVLNNDNYNSCTLCQKIDMFQSQLADFERKEQQHPEINGNEKCETPISTAKDEVAQELAKLFDEEPTDLSDLFGIDIDAVDDTDELRECRTQTEKLNPLTSPGTPLAMPKSKRLPDLRNSHWPCELYAQRRRLNACLVRLLDADWRSEEVLRYKFYMLFGEDSDDEFATDITSPSIELVDNVLLASCMLRIRPWIVGHLMRPLQEGLIANRFLFKKLAKTLANNIVLIDPYPSERQVKQAVEYLFCIQPKGVQNAVDLDSMPPVFIERFET